MKALIATILIAGVLRASAVVPSSVTTTDGTTYNHITSLRADPDGLYIEYSPDGNGLASVKVKFSRLSADLQKQYGYDANAAKQYEEGSYKAAQAYDTWLDQRDAVRQKAQADAAELELRRETILAQSYGLSQQSGAQPAGAYSSPGYYAGYGYPFVPAPRNVWTGVTYEGSVPMGMFTPIGYQPTRLQAIPATPGERPRMAERR